VPFLLFTTTRLSHSVDTEISAGAWDTHRTVMFDVEAFPIFTREAV